MIPIPMHAWHPLLVHLPIGLLLAGVAVEAAGWLLRRPTLRRAGLALMIAGTLFAVPTVATGLLAFGQVEHGTRAHEMMKLHRNLALSAVGAFLLAVFWRWRAGERVAATPLSAAAYGVLLTGATALLLLTGDRGARLVFDHALGLSSASLERIVHERQREHDHSRTPVRTSKDGGRAPRAGLGLTDSAAGPASVHRAVPETTRTPPPETADERHEDAERPPHEH